MIPPRLVILSDLHAHTWSAFARGDGVWNTRLRDGLRVLDESLARAREEACPWLFAGDIVHTAGYAQNEVLGGLTEVFARYPDVVKRAVWGNHDARGRGGSIVLEETVWAPLLRAVENLTVLERGWATELPNGLTVAGAGFQPRQGLLTEEGWEPADVGIFHQTISGSFAPSGHELQEGIPAALLTDLYEVPIVGHVHHPQKVDVPGTDRSILVPGSPEHQNFGDRGDHGWWVLTFDPDGNHALEFVPGGSPEFRTVDSAAEVKNDGHFYRVRNVADPTDLPENATFVAPEPTHVEERGLLRDASQADEVLQVWLKENPPEEPEGVEHSDDCALGLGGGCDCPALMEWDPGEYLAAGRALLAAQDPVQLRPYRLHSIRLHNFASYADEELVLREGVWLVTGQGRDYPSNGAGKSSLVGEAPFWLLFGTTTKGQAADEMVRRGTDRCEVEGWLEDLSGGPWLRVLRSRDGGSPALAVEEHDDPANGEADRVWEAAGVREMTAKLSRRLGLTADMYQHLAYFSQADLALFADATDGERKSLLADLVGLSAYEDARAAAGAKTRKLGRERDALRAARAAREEDMVGAEADAVQVGALADAWDHQRNRQEKDAQARLDALEEADPGEALADRAAALQRRAKALAETWERRVEEARERRVEEARFARAGEERDRLAKVDDRIDEASRTLTGEEDLTEERARTFAESVPRAEEQLREAREAEEAARTTFESVQGRGTRVSLHRQAVERALATARAEAEKVRASLQRGVCPSCGQEITGEHLDRCLAPAERKVREAEVMVEEAREKERPLLVEGREAKEAYDEARRRTQLAEAFLGRLRRIRERVQALDGLRARREDLAVALGRGVTEAEDAVDRELEREKEAHARRQSARVERAWDYVRRATEEHERAVGSARRDLAEIRGRENPHTEAAAGARERVRALSKKIEEAAEEAGRLGAQIAVHEYWERGFGKQGIQSLLLDEIAMAFNRARPRIFPVLTQGIYDVQMSTLSTTASGEVRERTEFHVWRRGEAFPYASLSGGERRRVDVGIMLTLTLAVAEWMGVPGVLGLMVLDEVLSFTDGSGAEGLLDALAEAQTTVPVLQVVTHDPHLQSLFPEVIRIEQDDAGVSRLVDR